MPPHIRPCPEGMKNDENKLLWHLLPAKEIEEVVKVLTHGAQKYADNNWQIVIAENPKRYEDAMLRHISDWRKGEMYDEDSGCHHLASVACNALFLLWWHNQVFKKGEK